MVYWKYASFNKMTYAFSNEMVIQRRHNHAHDMLISMLRTFASHVVTPGAIFCTHVIAVTAGQIVAEFTRHLTTVVVVLCV